MNYLTTIIQTSPLTLHFGFHHPAESESPVSVPRLLTPLGYFVSIVITGEKKQIVYESDRPKVKPKLHPARPESYLQLEPGYTYGVMLEVEDFQPARGVWQMTVTYSNREFQGFAEHPIGELIYQTNLAFKIG